jgi:hypothetical protein
MILNGDDVSHTPGHATYALRDEIQRSGPYATTVGDLLDRLRLPEVNRETRVRAKGWLIEANLTTHPLLDAIHMRARSRVKVMTLAATGRTRTGQGPPGTSATSRVTDGDTTERHLVAKFAPGLMHSMKLYANGDIEYSWGNQSGNVIGAVARVDQSGSERVFRDTRQAYITIEGPHVSISQKLATEGKSQVQFARQFAAKVNQVSQQLAAKAAAQNQPIQAPPAAAPAPAPDIPEQIRKLGELQQQGLLTEEEFVAKKTELLGRM